MLTDERDEEAVPETARDEFVRVPGLFRSWELEQVLVPGTDFHLEEAGFASDGTQLLALYRREQPNHDRNQEK